MTRRLAFRKCRGVARSRSLALIIFAFVAVAFLAQPKPPADVAAAAGTRAVADARWRPATAAFVARASDGRAGTGTGLRGTGTGTGTGLRGTGGGGRGRGGGGAVFPRGGRALAAVGRGTSADRRRIRRGGEGGDRDAGEERMGSAPGETFEGGDPRRAVVSRVCTYYISYTHKQSVARCHTNTCTGTDRAAVRARRCDFIGTLASSTGALDRGLVRFDWDEGLLRPLKISFEASLE